MRLAWDTSTDRVIASEALGKAFEKGLRARLLSRAAGVEIWSSRGGVVGLAAGGNETDVGHFEFSIVVHAKALRFVVAILDYAKADVVVRSESLFVIQHSH